MRILQVGPIKTNNKTLGEKKKIDLFAGLGFDGPTRSIIGLSHALANKGHEVGIVSTKPLPHGFDLNLKGVTVLPSYHGQKYNPFVNGDSWFDLIEKQYGVPDLVNFHDVYDFFSYALAKPLRKLKIPYIISPRGALRIHAQRNDRLKKMIINPLCVYKYVRGASFIQTLAQKEADEVKIFHQSLNPVLIPNGVPNEVIANAESFFDETRTFNTQHITIGFLGKIYVEVKGIDLILEAIRQLQVEGKGKNLYFEFAGPFKTKQDQSYVERALENLPNKERVKFVGPKLNVEKWQYLNDLDLFILPSRTEGMSNAVLEAMVMGKPCLLSHGTNMADYVEAIQGGWSIGQSSDDMAKVLELVSDLTPEVFQSYRENVLRHLKQNYTLDKVADTYLAAIDQFVHK